MLHALGQQTVGRFEVRDFLGRGAIGDVLLAWDPESESLVALKVVRASKTDPEMLEAEKNGLSLQKQLATVAPQVAAVYEDGQDGDLFWVAMEYVDGTDLSAVMARGPLAEPRAVAIACQLVSMLQVCHEFSAEVGGRRIAGIVHGDIKPENIRLQEHDHVRVLDFGIAKHLTQTRRFTVNLFGSLPYTPPERLERGVVDRHSDLWAVGVVLAAMVSGRRPFPGNTPEELEQALRHGVSHLPLPATCSPGLVQVVDRCLAFGVGSRYASAAELAADLAALRDGRPLPSAASGATVDVQATRRTARPLAPGESLSPEERRAAEATRRTDALPPIPSASPGTLGDTRRTAAAAAPVALVPMAQAPAALVAAPQGQVALVPEVLAPGAYGPSVAVPFAPSAPTTPKRRRRPLRRLAWGLALLTLLAVVVVQLWAYGQARRIRREMAEVHPDLQALALQYSDAAQWSFFSPDLFGVGDELLSSLIAAADRIFDSYHGDDPTTTQRGWQTAYDDLHAAAQIAPRDKRIRARMLYARGHLDRIASLALRNQGDRKGSLAASKEAASEFQEAGRWDPTWPDPFLGLARIYAYDQFDLDALQKTMGELGRRGYHLGRRETAMLADGFRMQGLELETRAQRARGTEAEVELLKQSQTDLEQAVRFYGDIAGYAYAASNRGEAQAHLTAIDQRLAQTHPAGFWERLGRALTREFVKPGGTVH